MQTTGTLILVGETMRKHLQHTMSSMKGSRLSKRMEDTGIWKQDSTLEIID